jgi:hypothetical protein
MILPNITNQQQAILSLVYSYRFLNRIQIQAFLHHKNKKTINTWLPDLVEKEYLKRIYSRGFSENTKPAIYYLGLNGIRYLKTLDDTSPSELRKRYRDELRTSTFVQQSLLLADIALSFLAKNIKSDGLYTVSTQTDLALESSQYGFLTDLNPNLVLISEKKKGITHYVLESFSPTTPKYSLKKRIRDFIKFYENGEWEENSDLDFPIILLVCPTKPTLIFAKRYVKKINEEEQFPDGLEIWCATEAQVRESGVSSKIWEES